MRAPLAWIRDYVALPDDLPAIVDKLAALGFPVADVEERPHISGVVTGTIVKLEKHPNADRLQVCTIDVAGPRMLTIATAADNVAQGQVIPVATIGARLPKLVIEPRKMRGIDSEGMLCSAEELGLPAEWFENGIMQLDADTPLGRDVVALFGLDLPVLDIEVNANRGDALAMVGIARELAAGLGAALCLPPYELPAVVPSTGDPAIAVTLQSPDVRRYVAQRVTGLAVGPAPAWIRVRLALAGQRPINNLVDISNFVMLELGQPLHFFDEAKIAEQHIIVRDAAPGETLVTLDGTTRELDPTTLVIADPVQATGLAGLMGGGISEVTQTTTAIVIESANFAGPRVRRMSLKLGLRTEASTRNEKGLPLAFADLGAARAAHLLAQIGGIPHTPHAFGQPVSARESIAFASSDIARLLGFSLDDDAVTTALEALGFTVVRNGPGQFTVGVPPWRTDVAIAADLVEEVARMIGYDRVEAVLPPVMEQAIRSDEFDREMAVARTLVGLGYFECLTLALQPRTVAERWRAYGFAVEPVVEIRNPLSEDQRYMRFSIVPALLGHAARHRETRPLRTFEIGRIFADAPDAPRETNVLTLMVTSKRIAAQPAWRDAAFTAVAADVRALIRAVTGYDVQFARATGAGFHPGKTARIIAGGIAVGMIGALDPRLVRAEDLDDDAIAAVIELAALPARTVRKHRALSKYPAVERDLALIVAPEIAASELLATIAGASELVRATDAFDEYRGPQIGADKKSLAVRVVLQRDDATLTDADADAAIKAVVGALNARHGAVLRE